MNKPLLKIDLGAVFMTLFMGKALYTGTWQDVSFVAILVALHTFRLWMAKNKLKTEDAFEARIKAVEAEVSALRSAIALKRSY
jgi:hypothetical protein